jgi:predicted nucleic acid-binding protein
VATKIVVDTSVLIKWIKTRDEEFHREALSLLEIIERDRLEIIVPALLLYEVGNLLLRKTRLASNAVAAALDHVLNLPITVVNPEPALLRRAARLGRGLELTFYDSSFLAVAEEVDGLFITADRRLFNAARRLPRVRHLSAVGSSLER